jgi:stage III sporulation protein AA
MDCPAFNGAAALLPREVRNQLYALSADIKTRAEEIRLRAGHPPSILLPEGERTTSCDPVSAALLSSVVEIATGASAYSSRSTMARGFVTAAGGYRIGFGGSMVRDGGKIAGYRAISSAAIRIPRQLPGIAREPTRTIRKSGSLSTLIISPPGGGKTTFLRDFVRIISDGDLDFPPRRVSLADERGEIASLIGGMAQFDVGARTDVLDGCPKAEAVMILLRVMNPEVIALDEITADADAEAIRRARNCGVALIATAHADGLSDLSEKPLYRALLSDRVFDHIITIRRRGGGREYITEDL